MLLPSKVFDGLDSLGWCAVKPVFQIVRGVLTIVEFAFVYDLLNHFSIIGLTGLRVKGYRLLAVR
ncbi:MAG: hypothetical protein GY794_15375 [bacterium]|nr:hypothetical protein [bacterium]